MSICRVFSCVVGRRCLLWPVRSWQNCIRLCSASFCTPRLNLPVTPCVSWPPTFAFGCSVSNWATLCDPMDCSKQQGSLSCLSLTPGAYSDSCPSSWWCHPTISSSVDLFFCLQSFPHQDLFQWVSSLHQVAKVLEFQLQHQFFQWIFRTDFP